jgi:hypothetical protein
MILRRVIDHEKAQNWTTERAYNQTFNSEYAMSTFGEKQSPTLPFLAETHLVFGAGRVGASLW